jgi:hypothetical protein
MLEIKVSEMRKRRQGGEFLEQAYKNGGGVIVSAHPHGLYPARKLVLTPVDCDLKPKDCISARKIYAGGLTCAAKAILEGKLYLRSASLGVAFKMELTDL